MATRKKKPDSTGTKMANVKKVVKGTHLTVTTHPDGRTELEWDDDALLREVQEATAPKKKVKKEK